MNSTKQYGFYVDTSTCSGFKTCMNACKDRNDMHLGILWRRVYEYAGGGFVENGDDTYTQNVYAYNVSVGCNHCSEPVCVKACPTGAMHKRRSDGFVLVEQSMCIGCESCARACPYDAPQLDAARKVMTKCDGCYDRVEKGLKPICVDSCTHRALEFGLIEDLRAKYGDNADVKPLPDSGITSPNWVVKAHKNENQGARIINVREI